MGFPVSNSPYGLCGRKAALKKKTESSGAQELFKVEEAVLGSLSLILNNSPYDLYGRKATLKKTTESNGAQELCESQGGCPGLPCP